MNTPCKDPDRHDGHTHGGDVGGLYWCDGDGVQPDDSDHALLDDLDRALVANGSKKVCPACDVIAAASESVRGPLSDAMAGTIGRDKLVQILRAHGHDVSRRVIERHRQEGHTAT